MLFPSPHRPLTQECQFAVFVEETLARLYLAEALAEARLDGKRPHAVLSSFKFREETLTETVIAELSLKYPDIISRAYTTTREASVSGADWLCIIQTRSLHLSLLIQAKRPTTPIHSYFGPWTFDMHSAGRAATSTRPARPTWYQRDCLIAHAHTIGAIPVYGLYAPGLSAFSCRRSPWRMGKFAHGTLHLVHPDPATLTDPFNTGIVMPGWTLSTLLCCPSYLSALQDASQFQPTLNIGEEQILSQVSEWAETGTAPRQITMFDFTDITT